MEGNTMEYTFEPLSEPGHFQVRLGGEFVTYTDHNDPAKVDERLREGGWSTREEYYNESIAFHTRDKNYYKKNV